jgi:DNA-binding transcriptional MerR regulator
MNRQIMTIRQLADRAGVTQRTIRYYTDEGLIDAPVDKVRMPRYTERHLLQLQAAAHLKAGYLPLRVIRARLAGLGDEELRELVASVPQPVATIVANTSIQAIEASHKVDRVMSGSNVALADEPDAEEAVQTDTSERRWHRVVIDDGIEIHFRDDRHLDSGDLRRLSAMVRRRP